MSPYRKFGALAASLVVSVASVAAQEPEKSVNQKQEPTNKELLNEIKSLRQRVEELEQGSEPAPVQLPGQGLGNLGQGNLLNPRITFFTDVQGSLSTNGDDRKNNRFSLREAEMDGRAALAPWADAMLVMAIVDEVEQDASGDIETAIEFELEEAFVNFHTLPADGLSLKMGKFRNAFGRNNRLHTHDLPQITRPLTNVAFFGGEGFSTVGVSAGYLIPNPWDEYLEGTVEVVNADGGEEAPILAGPNTDAPAVLARMNLFRDITETMTIDVGGTFMYAQSGDSRSSTANLWGADVALQWRDPEKADRHSLLIQSEAFWARNDVEDPGGTFRNDSFGVYAFAQYQFALNWYAGVRGDFTEFPDHEFRGPQDKDWAVSPYITWYITEFLRVRFEYQHLNREIAGVDDSQENFFLGLTYAFGAHPPHPYWVNR